MPKHRKKPRSLLPKKIDWYLCPETGSDANDGSSPETPMRTFKALQAKIKDYPWCHTHVNILSDLRNGESLYVAMSMARGTSFTLVGKSG